jgi:hypothetical protein
MRPIRCRKTGATWWMTEGLKERVETDLAFYALAFEAEKGRELADYFRQIILTLAVLAVRLDDDARGTRP